MNLSVYLFAGLSLHILILIVWLLLTADHELILICFLFFGADRSACRVFTVNTSGFLPA